jgi:anti-sigma factor RsiW
MLGPYLDGELEPARLIEIGEHVGSCEACREETQLLRAMRASLKRVVRTSNVPAGLRERIGNAMSAERVREDALTVGASAAAFGAAPSSTPARPLRTVVPLATAAALALVWGAVTRSSQPASTELRAALGDELLSELVREHSEPLPPDAIGDAVRGLGRYVGVPVQPASLERGGARLLGGRVLPLPSQRAAMLHFAVGSGDGAPRVSVIVYDAQKIQIDSANLAPRSVGTAEVRVGREKGYSVVVAQRAGVGYLVASDLDPDTSAKFAAMVYEDR